MRVNMKDKKLIKCLIPCWKRERFTYNNLNKLNSPPIEIHTSINRSITKSVPIYSFMRVHNSACGLFLRSNCTNDIDQ